MAENMKARNDNIYRVMETRPRGAAILLAQQYGISTKRVYQIYKKEKLERTKKHEWTDGISIRLMRCLWRSGFPKDGTKEDLYKMISEGIFIDKWGFRNMGVKTLDELSGLLGKKVVREEAGTWVFSSRYPPVKKRRLVFCEDEI